MGNVPERSSSEWLAGQSPRVDLEILEEVSPSQVLVAVRRIDATGEPFGTDQISLGWFPAPEPWLAHVLPL
jgi:hypothetical protein